MTRYTHKWTGNVYEVIAEGRMQAAVPVNDYDRVTIYQGPDGKFWVRPVAEFDERFEPIKEN